MIRKRIFTILTAVFMVLAFSAMSFAANQVNLKTTVPNIPKSSCYQAGTDTLEFDDGSKMAEGDVITITLNNQVTICKELNFFVTLGTTAGVLDMTGSQPASTTDLTGLAAINAAAAGSQWGFTVNGPVGSQVITLTLRQINTGTSVLNALTPANVMIYTGAAPTDRFVLKLFDSKIGVWAASGIHKWSAANTYATAATPEDNVLCVDTLTANYMGEYVQNTPNSVPGLVANKLNFTGDYVIAHIMSSQTFALVTCKGATCGSIPLGATTQAAATCVAFNYETLGSGVNGYCADHTAAVLPSGLNVPKFIIQSNMSFDQVNYIVSAEILVNGVAGERGVYWSNTLPTYKSSPTTTCDTAVGGLALGATSYLRGDGVTVPVPVAPIAGNCAGVAAGAKAVKFSTAPALLFPAAGDFFFELNLPPLNYNLAEVNPGDVVSVRVTFSKATCGSVTLDLCLGTFIASCPVGLVAGGGRLCPYVTSLAADDSYWNGIAVVNTSTVAGPVTLTAFKNDGSVNATYTTPSIAAGGMFVNILGNIPWVGTAPAGVPAYITVQAPNGGIPVGGLDAFVMMSDNNGDGQSMGYLCR